MKRKILVVGGVAGGASVAARARRLDEHAEIIVFERGPYPSFSNCCLPNFLSREIENSDDLILMSPETFKNQYNIDVRVRNEVTKILPESKKVEVKNLETGEVYQESYDKLALSPGAEVIMPGAIKGIDSKHVFPLRNVPDVRAIDNYIHENNVQDIVVVGGGFIGLEVMENLRRFGKNVTLVEALDQVMTPVDFEMAQILHKTIVDNGVDLIVSDEVVSIEENTVTLKSGKQVKAETVVMAVGVRPETALAKDCGIEIGETGAILVNRHYQTNYPDIYAVGDAIEVKHAITGKKTKLPLAGPAQMQARAAADHMYGRFNRNPGVIGSSVCRIFDMNVASTGLNEKACKAEGIDYRYAYVIPGDKVGLMPNCNPLFFKLIFEYPTGKILGAQAVGKGAVDRRVDIVATAIHFGASVEDLKDVELTYAPFFSTAKDVVKYAAIVATNILNDEFKQVPVTAVRGLVESGAFIIDVREKGEYERSHLKGAVNIPLSQFRQRMNEIPKDKPVYLHCRSAQRSYNAVRALQGNGYTEVYNIQGSFLGISFYEYYQDLITGRDKILTDYNFD
ncbi:MAG: FAD-dependent oxidoreductase [Ruminococcaceae bacterium]|nr:FAD-dependent oxidoreductase [Oscillospiraceae bacterium]